MLGKDIEEVQLGRCSTSLRAGPEANVDSVPERSLLALTFSSSTTNTCDLGLVSSRADCIAVSLSCFSQIKRSIDFPALQLNRIEL